MQGVCYYGSRVRLSIQWLVFWLLWFYLTQACQQSGNTLALTGETFVRSLKKYILALFNIRKAFFLVWFLLHPRHMCLKWGTLLVFWILLFYSGKKKIVWEFMHVISLWSQYFTLTWTSNRELPVCTWTSGFTSFLVSSEAISSF